MKSEKSLRGLGMWKKIHMPGVRIGVLDIVFLLFPMPIAAVISISDYSSGYWPTFAALIGEFSLIGGLFATAAVARLLQRFPLLVRSTSASRSAIRVLAADLLPAAGLLAVSFGACFAIQFWAWSRIPSAGTAPWDFLLADFAWLATAIAVGTVVGAWARFWWQTLVAPCVLFPMGSVAWHLGEAHAVGNPWGVTFVPFSFGAGQRISIAYLAAAVVLSAVFVSILIRSSCVALAYARRRSAVGGFFQFTAASAAAALLVVFLPPQPSFLVYAAPAENRTCISSSDGMVTLCGWAEQTGWFRGAKPLLEQTAIHARALGIEAPITIDSTERDGALSRLMIAPDLSELEFATAVHPAVMVNDFFFAWFEEVVWPEVFECSPAWSTEWHLRRAVAYSAAWGAWDTRPTLAQTIPMDLRLSETAVWNEFLRLSAEDRAEVLSRLVQTVRKCPAAGAEAQALPAFDSLLGWALESRGERA